MISFSCAHCGLKLKVKPEFAGRSSKCPTCKKPLVVPSPDRTEGHVPKGEIDGTPSSVHQAGVDGGVTLGDTGQGQKSMRELLAKGKAGGQRYVISEEIARGGMGAVLRAIDCDIRREVAVKYMLDQTDAKKKARFVEEAQITGQLEHPNIVPIHELGVDAKKRLFFSMKMVKGRSLAQVLDELCKNPKQAEKEWTLTRLLNIFVSVCNGMAYAHSRGVVNRDAKPANVMVGDFGEVYVMDWGLAKVLGQNTAPALASAAVASVSSSSSSKVSTSREPDADLTQEGAIVGTPVYMPPEQAMGEIGEIDQRSDVYSLGAILYEMLALVPPIEKEGGYLNILMRVSEGDIKAPEARVPQRASRIPKELSAVAMMALAKEKKDRYQTVETLRTDIERFLEGRSVSAKQDTAREMVWKLVKRNKGFSAASFTASILIAVILFYSFKHIYQARAEAVDNLAAFKKEQEEKRAQGKKAVPAFVDAARLSVERKKLDAAMAQVDVALGFDEDYADACLLKGQLLIAQKDFPAARKELDKYLKHKPGDADTKLLVELCRTSRPDDTAGLMKFAEVFLRQKMPALAEIFISSREKMLPVYRQRIEAAWPGLGVRLTMDTDGECKLNLAECKQVARLDPLNGMPIHSLILNGCVEIRELAPIKGMPLTTLDLAGCGQVKDLSPLQGMPLTTLNLTYCLQLKDLSPLKGTRLTNLSLSNCTQITDLSPLQGMPLTTLDLDNCNQLKDLLPLQGMLLKNLNLYNCFQIKDLSPLQGMPLSTLSLRNCGQVRDLTLLKGMPLTTLCLSQCPQITNLSPLKGMPLTTLCLDGCSGISDFTPLRGMPLTSFEFHGCQSKDLTPLEGMNLQAIYFTPKIITKGMDVLRNMKSLKSITGLPATEFWKKYDAGEFNK